MASMITIKLPRGIDASLHQIIEDEISRCTILLADKYGFSAKEAEESLSGFKIVKKRGPIPKLTKEIKVSTPMVQKGSEVSSTGATKSGYLLFSKARRAEVRERLSHSLEGDKKLAPQLVVKELAEQWSALSELEKKEWSNRNKTDTPKDIKEMVPGVNQSDGKLTREKLVEIKAGADSELSIEYERMTHWTESEALDYFGSGGEIEPDTEVVSRLPFLKARRDLAQHPPECNEEIADEPQSPPKGALIMEEESEVVDDELDPDEVETEEEETPVMVFEVMGVQYLKDEDNMLYDFKTHEVIGVWDEESMKIVVS